MFRSLRLGVIRGTSVYVHWTFWVLVAIYGLGEMSRGGLSAGIEAGAFVCAVMACVLAHEFGHVVAAERYGIKTTDITLMIVGGMARLQRLPKNPMEELVVAIAGPAVNVLIAAALFAASGIVAVLMPASPIVLGLLQFMQSLLIANVVLVAFNLLPAFPMDGGRVLRSLLSMRIGNLQATEIAAQVGRWMACAFAVGAIAFWQFPLLMVAGFVYVAGSSELMQVRLNSVRSANNTEDLFARFTHNNTQYVYRSYQEGEVVDALEVREIK